VAIDPPTGSSSPDLSFANDEQMIEHAGIRKRRSRERSPLGLNPVAMIDVVFLLLIYFMTATEFTLGEEIYRMDLPQRLPAAQVLDPFELDEDPLRIAVATMLEQRRTPPMSVNKRSAQVNVRLTAEEKLLLTETAKREGFKGLSDFIRHLALAHTMRRSA